MAAFMAWLQDPLHDANGRTSVWRLFLALGLVSVLLAAWAQIFAHIRDLE